MRAEKQDDERPTPYDIANTVKDLHAKNLSFLKKEALRAPVVVRCHAKKTFLLLTLLFIEIYFRPFY